MPPPVRSEIVTSGDVRRTILLDGGRGL